MFSFFKIFLMISFSIHCYAHSLSLSIKKGLEADAVKELLIKVKRLAASFNKSPTATKILRECGAVESMKSVSQ